MTVLVPRGALAGPGAPDPDLVRFRTKVLCSERHGKHGIVVIVKLQNLMNISSDVLHFLKLTRRRISPNPYLYNVTRA